MKKLIVWAKENNKGVIFAILVIPIIFFIAPLTQTKVLYWGTTSTQFFPWMEYAIQQILSSQFPLWNPYNGWGAPLMANYQSALFYPLNWLLIIFYLINKTQGLYFGYTVLLILHLQIGGIGFLRLLSRLGLSSPAKLLGSMTFILSGYILGRINFISMVWAAIWLPWILCGVLDLFNIKVKTAKKIQLSLLVPLTLQLFAGHAQTAYYTLLVASIYFVFLMISHSHNKQTAFKYILNLLLSAGLAAVQLIPTAEYLLNSQRSAEVGYETAANFSLWPWRLLSTVFPDFWGNPAYGRYLGGGNYWEDHLYLGIIPFILVLFGIFVLIRNKEKMMIPQAVFFKVSLCLIPLSIMMALGKNFFLYPFFYNYVPGFDMFQAPSRFLLIYTFCGAVLAAFGFEFWQKKYIPARKIGIFIFIFIAIVLGVWISRVYLQVLPVPIEVSIFWGSGMAILFGTLSILKSKIPRSDFKAFNAVVIVLIFVEFFVSSSQNELFKPIHYYDAIHEKNKTWTSEIVYLENKTETFIKFNQNFRFDRFQDFKPSSSADLMFLPNTNLFSPQYKMINNFDPFVPGNYSEFMTELISLPKSKQKIILEELGMTSFISLDSPLEDKPAVHRVIGRDAVQWFDCSLVLPPDEILTDLIYNEAIIDKQRCLFLSGNKNSNEYVQRTTSHFNPVYLNIFDQQQSLEISYTSEKEGWLLIRNNFYPGWRAVLDDEVSIKLYEADYLFTGMHVPAGNHTIIFSYQPLSFWLGGIMSIISILIIIFLIRNSF